MFIAYDNYDNLFNMANSELAKLSIWLNDNKLHVNYDKTNYMIFEPKSSKLIAPISEGNKITFGGHVINKISSTKYLGVVIDDKLTWTEHINYLIVSK